MAMVPEVWLHQLHRRTAESGFIGRSRLRDNAKRFTATEMEADILDSMDIADKSPEWTLACAGESASRGLHVENRSSGISFGSLPVLDLRAAA
jgi:hypothetical protein